MPLCHFSFIHVKIKNNRNKTTDKKQKTLIFNIEIEKKNKLCKYHDKILLYFYHER